MRTAVQTEKRVAITLWFLASGSDYRTVDHLFGVAKATVCVIVKEVCTSIVKLLLPRYIQIPTGTALKEIVDGFKTNHSFPQCTGAVDGCHIPIVSPQQCPADYFNRKGWHSIILQGPVEIVVDLLMYMLDGQVVYTMHVFFQIPVRTKRGRAISSLLTLNKRLLEKTFRSSYWVIQPTLCCSD